MSINLDSFRAMVGANNYGEVRLSAKGGLEIINNHFAQRCFKIAKTNVSAEENKHIRDMFLASVADYVDADTYGIIRERLGIAGRYSLSHGTDQDVYKKPLSRREIKEVLDLVDQRLLSKACVTETASVAALRNGGEAYLATLLDQYNQANPTEKITASADQLKVIVQRHGLELQRFAGEAELNGKSVKDIVAKMVISYLATEELVGKKALFGKTARANGVALPQDTVPMSVKMALSRFGIRHESFAKIADRANLQNLTADDFDVVSFTTLEGENTHDIADCLQEHNGEKITGSVYDGLVEMLKKNLVGSMVKNMTRNPIRVTIEAHDAPPFVSVAEMGTEEKAYQENNKTIDQIFGDIRQLGVTADQLVAASKVMNQTVFNLCKTFGANQVGYANVQGKISKDHDDIVVTFVWNGQSEGHAAQRPMSFTYRVGQDGMGQVQSIKFGDSADR